MNSSADPPSEALKQSLAAALEAYRETCFEINFPALKEAVASVNESVDEQIAAGSLEEEEGYERFEELREIYLSSEFTLDAYPDELEEAIPAFNDLLDPDVARGFLHNVAPPQSERALEHLPIGFEELQRRVNEQAVPGEDATLPAEYRAFATLAESVVPPGLPDRLTSLDKIFHNAISAIEVPSMEGLGQRFNFIDAGWKVYAGFITQSHTLKLSSCSGWVLCEMPEDDYDKDTSKKWRIVFSYLGDSFLFNFNSVEAFLRWYSGYGVRELGEWDDDTESYA